MIRGNDEERPNDSKLAYEKPKLQTIELLADEVLSVGCKLSVDTLAYGDNPCTLEICFSVGS